MKNCILSAALLIGTAFACVAANHSGAKAYPVCTHKKTGALRVGWLCTAREDSRQWDNTIVAHPSAPPLRVCAHTQTRRLRHTQGKCTPKAEMPTPLALGSQLGLVCMPENGGLYLPMPQFQTGMSRCPAASATVFMSGDDDPMAIADTPKKEALQHVQYLRGVARAMPALTRAKSNSYNARMPSLAVWAVQSFHVLNPSVTLDTYEVALSKLMSAATVVTGKPSRHFANYHDMLNQRFLAIPVLGPLRHTTEQLLPVAVWYAEQAGALQWLLQSLIPAGRNAANIHNSLFIYVVNGLSVGH